MPNSKPVSQLAGEIYEAIGKETQKIADETPYCRYSDPSDAVKERMLQVIESALSSREEKISRLVEAAKRAHVILTHPNPEAWPAGYGAWWSEQKRAIAQIAAALQEME